MLTLAAISYISVSNNNPFEGGRWFRQQQRFDMNTVEEGVPFFFETPAQPPIPSLFTVVNTELPSIGCMIHQTNVTDTWNYVGS